ncbi:MAG: PspC domain-containing protein [Melioribacter sp.]|nr:PspC domain-containing protein [Melioribacter sp.]
MEENKFPNIFEDKEEFPYPIRRFERSRIDYVITGLLGGLGKYYNVDPSIFRLIGILSLLINTLPIYLYLIASLIFNAEINSTTVDEKEKIKIIKKNSQVLLSSFLIFIGIFWLLKSLGIMQKADIFYSNSILMNLIVVLLGVYLVFKNFDNEIISTIYNNNKNKLILGVCKELSYNTKINVILIRLAFVVCTILTAGIIVLLYLFLFINLKREKII